MPIFHVLCATLVTAACTPVQPTPGGYRGRRVFVLFSSLHWMVDMHILALLLFIDNVDVAEESLDQSCGLCAYVFICRHTCFQDTL
jgi:hypothetical protein